MIFGSFILSNRVMPWCLSPGIGPRTSYGYQHFEIPNSIMQSNTTFAHAETSERSGKQILSFLCCRNC